MSVFSVYCAPDYRNYDLNNLSLGRDNPTRNSTRWRQPMAVQPSGCRQRIICATLPRQVVQGLSMPYPRQLLIVLYGIVSCLNQASRANAAVEVHESIIASQSTLATTAMARGAWVSHIDRF
jgi:hypothetical protein